MAREHEDDIVTLEGRRCTCVVIEPVSEHIAPLVGDSDEPFGAWPDLTEVKHSTVRTVRRGTIAPDLDVHLKVYRAVRLSDHAREAIRGARAVREFERLREARQRGLPCVEPLAAGRWHGSFGARSFLITRTFDGSPLPRGPLDLSTAAKAGELLRAAHDAGLHARDLHPENVLRGTDGRLALCDLTSAVFASPLENDERAHALAFFCLGVDGGLADPAVAPLVHAYGADRKLVDEAVRVGRKLRTRALEAFGRRATRQCRHTRVEDPDESGATWFLHSGAESLWEAARTWVTRPRPDPLRSGRRGAVWIEPDIVVKRRPAAAARRLLRAAYWLLFADVACAMPIAMRLRHGEGLVFSARLPRPDLATELAENAIDDQELVPLATAFGRDVGRLHALGLRNRDMKLENLVRTGNGRIAPVDLDGVRRKPPLDARGEGADLGRLLAAWRRSSNPFERCVVRAFWRGYHRARSCLGRTPPRRLRMRTAVRAQEWAAAHPSTCGGESDSP